MDDRTPAPSADDSSGAGSPDGGPADARPAADSPDVSAADSPDVSAADSPDVAAGATAGDAAGRAVADDTPVLRAAMAPPEAGPRRPRVAELGLTLLVVVLAFGAGIAIGRASAQGGAPVAEASAAATASSSAPTEAPSGLAGLPSDGPRLGRADAQVTVDYWADYQCPFCARFAQQVIPQLAGRLEDGTIALLHHDYAFLGSESVDAAVAVQCAARQGRYWPMHDAIYAAQVGENQGAFARPRLEQIAALVGLDASAFAACLDEREPMIEVLAETAAGVREGVTSTPTIEVNGTRFAGVPDVTRLFSAIDAAAGGASPRPLPTRPPVNDPWAGVPVDGREAGAPSAPVTVELWIDYQDPAYRDVLRDLEAGLRTRIKAGSISVMLRDLATLGDESVLAAAAVRCVADQGGPAWLMHDALAASGQGAGQGIYSPRSILQFAAYPLGLDVRALSDCLDDPEVADAVATETMTGTDQGLTAAPAVIVRDGTGEAARFTGKLDAAKILAAIDKAG